MKAERLSLKIQNKTLLHPMSFEIPRDSIFLIMGPNGAGKTLLLKALAGLLPMASGEIVNRSEPFSWVPLSQALPFSNSVEDVVLMGRYQLHQGYAGRVDREKVDRVLNRLGIEELKTRDYNSLSRGEQTKVDLARALAAETSLLFLDEPFANLDIDASLQIRDLLHDLKKEGKTIVLSHHDLFSAKDLGTHGLILNKGQLVIHGDISEVLRPSHIESAFGVRALFDESGRILRFQRLKTPTQKQGRS